MPIIRSESDSRYCQDQEERVQDDSKTNHVQYGKYPLLLTM